MSQDFLAGQASLWIQPNGANTEPKYLGCHAIGDIPVPKGDTTLLWCPDPAQAGKFVVKNSFTGEPGTITTTIDTDLRSVADYLEDMADEGCPFNLFVHKVISGRRDVFSNFDRSFVLRKSKVTTRTLQKLASRNPADEGESTQSFDLSVDELLSVFNMEASRVSVSETEDLTAIAVAGEIICADPNNTAQRPQDELWVSSKALTGSAANTADILRSSNDAAFAATTSDPFTGGMDVQGVVAFKISRTTTRILVFNGTTQVSHPAECAYSDDLGATWTRVHIGSTNAEFIQTGRAVQALDLYHIWVGTSGGRIYFSGDGGITWTVQENAVISATAIVGLSMYDGENGAVIYTGGQVAKTTDGLTWAATTVSGLTNGMDIHMIYPQEIWAVGTQGKYYSMDGGTTFSLRDSNNTIAIDFLNDSFGIAVGGVASNAPIWTTIDGGYDWLASPAIANAGFNFVEIVSTKLAYITGAASAGTGFLAKLQPAA